MYDAKHKYAFTWRKKFLHSGEAATFWKVFSFSAVTENRELLVT